METTTSSNATTASATTSAPVSRALRDLLGAQVLDRWTTWAQAHPHLAQAIDQTRLVESAVQRLSDDPQFQAALAQAKVDETQLQALAQVWSLAQRWIARALPL